MIKCDQEMCDEQDRMILPQRADMGSSAAADGLAGLMSFGRGLNLEFSSIDSPRHYLAITYLLLLIIHNCFLKLSSIHREQAVVVPSSSSAGIATFWTK